MAYVAICSYNVAVCVCACEALALMLEDGADGVDQDLAAALRWHLAAAEKGNAVLLACKEPNKNVPSAFMRTAGWPSTLPL